MVGPVLIDSRHGLELGVEEGLAAVAVDAFPGPRLLSLHGVGVFELSWWCGTCPALIRRLSQPDAGDLEAANRSLNAGLSGIDDEVLRAYGRGLPASTYSVLLLHVRPRLISPGGERDYFVEEQVNTWGYKPGDGSGAPASSAYYRSFEAAVDDERHLYELIVPMVPPGWNDAARVADYQQPPGGVATAVAYTLFDVLAPATERGKDWYRHWLLQHFLLDGHHKVEAAARSGGTVRLLAFVDEANSKAKPQDLVRMVQVRASHRPGPRRRKE